jgi:anaphase-promoting complex subunit 8
MIALTFYGKRDFEKARQVFERIQQLNPYRLENLDTFSNILYVMECKAELSHLAHQCVKVDKFRSETCCIVGNYYSLKGQHEKSIIQFQRALKVNFRCLSAWTLMGHEYVEMHKTSAAVHCYRKAIEMNSADYRAWYGLGQTYEMLHLHQYALYYFRKAASLRPADARMWNAVGTCLSRLGTSSGSREVSWRSKNEAIEAYERAVNCDDAEGLAARELARLHREMGNSTKAAHFYLYHLQSRDKSMNHAAGDDDTASPEGSQGGYNDEVDVDLAEGLLFVASYYFDKNDLRLAEKYCMRLLDFRGPEGAEAKSILREIRSLAHDKSTQSVSGHDSTVVGSHETGEQEDEDGSCSFNLMDSNDSIHDAFI